MKKILKRKITKIIPILLILFTIYIYILTIEGLPIKMVMFEGETLSINSLLGLSINTKNKSNTVEAISNNSEKTLNEPGKQEIEVNLFNNILLKQVSVDVIPKTKVIPIGNIAGLKLYTNGVLVVGMSEIEGKDSKKYKPYEHTGIEEGDTIISVNNLNITTAEELTKTINKSQGNKVDVKYIHEEETKECSITPIETIKSEYKLGLWVRDSAAGVGTVTYYEPETKSFAALGHGITDIDTNKLINISSGQFVTTRVLNIKKGESGNPGKIQGSIENGESIGEINKNSKFGVYGKIENLRSLKIDTEKEMEVALRNEIKEGQASILCSLDNQNIKEYKIQIEKIYKENNYDNKSMKIKVIDQELIDKTGGIIQGMSGAPIIQNGKFIGAVTNVLVSNPQEGYAIFGDIMIKEMRSINNN